MDWLCSIDNMSSVTDQLMGVLNGGNCWLKCRGSTVHVYKQ